MHLNKASKLDEYFALLFKSIKADPEPQRVLAFVRRLVQMATINEPSYTAATLLIISELIRCKNDLRFQLYSLDQISKQQRQSGSKGADQDDDDEEHFIDVDKVEQSTQKKVVEGLQNTAYDPLKREPKYANAEACALFELVSLTFHTHPTIKLWATNLLEGQLITYNGDPLLDFGLANFLDRIAYKNPKSLDKVAAKFASGRRMAATETPINMLDPEALANHREEEEYLAKYFQARGPRVSKTKKDTLDRDGDESEEDPELEDFANDVIEKEMKKMNAGADALEDEDEDVLSELEEGSDFFDGEEDLQDVNVDDAEDEEEEEQEMNVSGEDDDEEIEEIEYGGEDDDEEEDDDIFQKPSGKKKEKAPKKSIFADYEEFAHLLEGDLYDGDKKKKGKHDTGPRIGRPNKRPRK